MNAAYDQMLWNTEHPYCWNCGAWANDAPGWWHGPFLIERSHIVAKPRKEDRRAVILLCSWCHKGCVHGERYQYQRPRLTVANQLWLKSAFDAEYFDPEWLQRCSTSILPKAEKPTFFPHCRNDVWAEIIGDWQGICK